MNTGRLMLRRKDYFVFVTILRAIEDTDTRKICTAFVISHLNEKNPRFDPVRFKRSVEKR